MDTFDFVNRANAEYIDRLYQQYQKDPRSVEDHWKAFFAGFELGLDRTASGTTPPPADSNIGPQTDWSTAGIFDLVHSYRELGHFVAKLDPLGHDRPNHPLLELSNFGITSALLDQPVTGGGLVGWTSGTLRQLVERLRATYTPHHRCRIHRHRRQNSAGMAHPAHGAYSESADLFGSRVSLADVPVDRRRRI